MSKHTYRKVIQKLKKHGFSFRRQGKGSHELWGDENAHLVVIAKHPGEIPQRTMNSIAKQAGFKNLHDFDND